MVSNKGTAKTPAAPPLPATESSTPRLSATASDEVTISLTLGKPVETDSPVFHVSRNRAMDALADEAAFEAPTAASGKKWLLRKLKGKLSRKGGDDDDLVAQAVKLAQQQAIGTHKSNKHLSSTAVAAAMDDSPRLAKNATAHSVAAQEIRRNSRSSRASSSGDVAPPQPPVQQQPTACAAKAAEAAQPVRCTTAASAPAESSTGAAVSCSTEPSAEHTGAEGAAPTAAPCAGPDAELAQGIPQPKLGCSIAVLAAAGPNRADAPPLPVQHGRAGSVSSTMPATYGAGADLGAPVHMARKDLAGVPSKARRSRSASGVPSKVEFGAC